MFDEDRGTPPARVVRRALMRLFPAALCSALALSLVLSRVAFTGSRTYLFLGWNLLLAWVPLLIAYLFAHVPAGRRQWPALFALGGAWLIFFPNAPYLVTDLLHLHESRAAPKWFDASMLFTFAWAGCVAGFLSLSEVHARVRRAVGPVWGWGFVAAVSALTGFGVYLGRFGRWNSWDVVSRPEALFEQIARLVLNPMDHPRMLGFTAQFAAVLLAAYATFLHRLTPAPDAGPSSSLCRSPASWGRRRQFSPGSWGHPISSVMGPPHRGGVTRILQGHGATRSPASWGHP